MTPGAGSEYLPDPVRPFRRVPKGWSRQYAVTVDAECSSCPYWRAPYRTDLDQDHGECRRRAPGCGEDPYPFTEWGDWCGEHPAMAGAVPGTWNDEDERHLWKVSA